MSGDEGNRRGVTITELSHRVPASSDFRDFAENLPHLAWIADQDGWIFWYNRHWYDYTGKTPAEMEGWGWQSVHNPEMLPDVMEAWQRSIATGAPFDMTFPLRAADGTFRPFLTRGQPVRDGAGHVRLWFGTNTDVSDQQKIALELAEEKRILETLNSTAAMLSAELDLEKLVQRVTDAAVALTGAQFGAFFYNVLNEAGESYTLYTISGVPREEFSKFPMPRNTAVFAPTFRGDGVVRSDDITKDSRYGRNKPHTGMPEGHLPVRSYLAVPVVSRSGEVMGGLFFGHAATGRFVQEHEDLLVGLAAQAAIGIDNARLLQAMQQMNQTLELRVAERTGELSQTNEALRVQMAERELIEEQLRQAQKMEAIGQLTGGIAHDFNNLLQGIVGSLDIVQRRVAEGRTEGIGRFITAALTAANRAAALTHRLLAFARRQPLDPKPVKVNQLVASMEELLRRTMGESISIELVLAGGLWMTRCDSHQLENAILNLAINARDAMPGGGKLTIETCNAHLDNLYAAKQRDVTPGQYVCVCVTDTGTGMPPDVLARAFDPFFTTKPTGQGTGLGLSMIYGFARQSEGYAKLYSEIDKGTTVKLYLPATAAPRSRRSRCRRLRKNTRRRRARSS